MTRRKMPPFRWQRVNDEPFEYGIGHGPNGDEFLKLADGSSLRRPLGFDYSLHWYTPEPQRVLEVLKEVGIHRLANFDGCLCGCFAIRNVKIEISCGKGADRGIKISSRSMDYPASAEELEKVLCEVGNEVQRQIDDLHDGRGPIPVHYLKSE